VETEPTFAWVEVRTAEDSSEPLAKLENISAAEDIASLVRKALDAVAALKTLDEEDVRVWIQVSSIKIQ
jgi:hypothetical protein